MALPSSGSIPINASNFWDQHYIGMYFQDDWRLTRKLTLNLGLRWDVERPLIERDNRLWARYDPNYVQTAITSYAQPGYAAIVGGAATNPGIAVLQNYGASPSNFIAKGGYEYAGVNGTPRSVLNTRYKYFQPRIGFAYAFTDKTSLKGGLGRFVQSNFDGGVSAQQYGFSTTTPLVASLDGYKTIAPGFSMANPYASGLNQPTGNSLGELTSPGNLTGYRDPNYGRAYTDTTSITLQQQIRDFLVEIGGTLNLTHGLSFPSGINVNLPSHAAWVAEYSPTFTNGRPDDMLPANVLVSNPFYKGPYMNTVNLAATTSVSQLIRPNPIRGDIAFDTPKGKTTYYALNTKVERRYHNGFSLLQAFTWAKNITEDNFIAPQGFSQLVERRLSSGDIKFHYTMTPIYTLPFGRGKWLLSHASRGLEQVVGGWEVAGIYTLQSGVPVVMPTNTAFFLGGDPSGAPRGRASTWFNTNAFRAYPSKSTSNATLSAYPAWTGVTGLQGFGYQPNSTTDAQNGVYQDFTTYVTFNQTTFGDIRQPYVNQYDLGLRKNFNMTDIIRLELRIDAFNAFNHPRFGGIGTDPNSAYFGMLSGAANLVAVNNPRQIQLSGKFFF